MKNSSLNWFFREATELYQQEIAYNDLKSLNQDRKATDNSILYLNIRGLKTNFEKLQIVNKRLKIEPYVIVCAETGNLEHYSNGVKAHGRRRRKVVARGGIADERRSYQ